jgi:hypothetical protein
MPLSKELRTAWFSDLPKDKQEDFKKLVLNSTAVLSKVKRMLEQRLTELDDAELKVEFYSTPEVSHRQTFNAGKKAEVKRFLSLLDFL